MLFIAKDCRSNDVSPIRPHDLHRRSVACPAPDTFGRFKMAPMFSRASPFALHVPPSVPDPAVDTNGRHLKRTFCLSCGHLNIKLRHYNEKIVYVGHVSLYSYRSRNEQGPERQERHRMDHCISTGNRPTGGPYAVPRRRAGNPSCTDGPDTGPIPFCGTGTAVPSGRRCPRGKRAGEGFRDRWPLMHSPRHRFRKQPGIRYPTLSVGPVTDRPGRTDLLFFAGSPCPSNRTALPPHRYRLGIYRPRAFNALISHDAETP